MPTDLRIKIINSPRGIPGRIDARKLLIQKKQLNRHMKNQINALNSNLNRGADVPFLIPRRTITNEYFGCAHHALPARHWNHPGASVSKALVRTIENKPLGTDTLTQSNTLASTISPIQGFRVEARNLLPSVTIDDIYELFSGVGSLRSCSLAHPGQAEVIFNSPQDAQSAVTRYNGRELDGRPMIVTLTTPLVLSPPTASKDFASKSFGNFPAVIQKLRTQPSGTKANLNRDVTSRAWNRSASNPGRILFQVTSILNQDNQIKNSLFDEAVDVSTSDSDEVLSTRSFIAEKKGQRKPMEGRKAACHNNNRDSDEIEKYFGLDSEKRSKIGKISLADKSGKANVCNSSDEESGDGENEEGDEDIDSDANENESSHLGALAGLYNPTDFEHLIVSPEVKEMFQHIQRYIPQKMDLETRLQPFIPEYIAAVGDADAFLKIPRPDGKPDNLGLTLLDEPSTDQSDSTLLDLQLRAISKRKTAKEMAVKSIEDPERNGKEIDKWIKSITNLHLSKPPPAVHYTKPMPDLTSLMSEWPEDFEKALKTAGIPTALLGCNLKEYVEIICAMMDVPVYSNRVESLHLLFSVYMEFKNSQHFQKSENKKLNEEAISVP
ncbi:hypothetical protein TcWFU_004274 [Taenia crassiceps]|uniref:Intraflagellar transport protein 46 homolog n=1 Tax=Taenia crassiceps TaxID=6207 RepID=A0ABR4Q3S1_9CEST